MTIAQARKILGKDAENVSDQDLEKDIETATFLKDIFFDQLIKSRKQPIYNASNVP